MSWFNWGGGRGAVDEWTDERQTEERRRQMKSGGQRTLEDMSHLPQGPWLQFGE